MATRVYKDLLFLSDKVLLTKYNSLYTCLLLDSKRGEEEEGGRERGVRIKKNKEVTPVGPLLDRG